MGRSLAALLAGIIPKTTPMNKEKPNAIKTIGNETVVVSDE